MAVPTLTISNSTSAPWSVEMVGSSRAPPFGSMSLIGPKSPPRLEASMTAKV